MFNTTENTEVKERILIEAQKLFIEKGYRGTSVRDIAKASETNIAMVNYYYKSKYKLFEIIFEEALDILTQRVFTTVKSDLPLFELIETWINTYYEILFEYPQIAVFILNEINLDPKALTKRIKAKEPYKIYSIIEARIEEEIANGTIRETPTADFLLNILSLSMFPFMFGTLAITLMEIPIETYNNLIENHKKYVVQFVINALQPVSNNQNRK